MRVDGRGALYSLAIEPMVACVFGMSATSPMLRVSLITSESRITVIWFVALANGGCPHGGHVWGSDPEA